MKPNHVFYQSYQPKLDGNQSKVLVLPVGPVFKRSKTKKRHLFYQSDQSFEKGITPLWNYCGLFLVISRPKEIRGNIVSLPKVVITVTQLTYHHGAQVGPHLVRQGRAKRGTHNGWAHTFTLIPIFSLARNQHHHRSYSVANSTVMLSAT